MESNITNQPRTFIIEGPSLDEHNRDSKWNKNWQAHSLSFPNLPATFDANADQCVNFEFQRTSLVIVSVVIVADDYQKREKRQKQDSGIDEAHNNNSNSYSY
jgi:hypothetical protein